MTSTRPVRIRQPRPHDIVDDPVVVAGVGTAFEGTLQLRVRNHRGHVLAHKHFMAGGTGIWANFVVRIDVPGVPASPHGTVEVYELSAEDGSEINKHQVRVVFGRALVDPYTGYSVHTVAAGETLSSIAQEWYGDSGRYHVIFQANRSVLDDPDLIFPGQELRIPQ